MSDIQPLEILRPAGLLERFLIAKHALGFFKNVGVSATYTFQARVVALEPLIYRALGELIADHPILTAKTVDEDSPAPYYVRIPQIDLRQCVTFIPRKRELEREESIDLELDEILEREHNKDFRELSQELPFWRVTVLYGVSNFTVAFVFHHGISDGTSGLAFHRHLLWKIENILSTPESIDENALDINYVVLSPEKPLFPAIESIHDLPISREYLLRISKKGDQPNSVAKLWTGPDCSPSLYRSRFRSFTVSPATTFKLLSASRANSTTITALTDALIAATLFAHLPSEYNTLRSDGAISFRRHLPTNIVDENSMGTWTSRYVVNHHRSAGRGSKSSMTALNLFSWDDARRIRKIIQETLEKNGADSSVGLLRYVSDYIDLNKKRIGKPRAESFESSNIGVFKERGKRKTCKVGRMVFSQSADAVGAAFEASIVTGGDGSMTVGISWFEGLIDSEWMDRVIETLRTTMGELALMTDGPSTAQAS